MLTLTPIGCQSGVRVAAVQGNATLHQPIEPWTTANGEKPSEVSSHLNIPAKVTSNLMLQSAVPDEVSIRVRVRVSAG